MSFTTIALIIGGIILLRYFLKSSKAYFITNIDKQGFQLAEVAANNTAKAPTQVVYWKNLKNAEFAPFKSFLILQDIRNKSFKIPIDCVNWHVFMEEMPDNFKNFDYDYAQKLAKQYAKTIQFNVIDATPHHITFELLVMGKTYEQSFAWQDVTSAQLNEDKTALHLTFQNIEDLTFTDDIDNWYWLLKYMPERFDDVDYIKAMFESFEPCDICGNVAVLSDMCQACYEDVWKKTVAYPSKKGYIKERQLELFSTDSPLEKVVWEVPEGIAFDKNPDWKLLVTEEEVRVFSQENFWPED